MTDFVNSSFSPDGNVSFQNVYIYGTLHYDFEDKDLTLKSLNVTGKTILNDDIDLSGNLNVNNDAKIAGIATFNNIEITGKLTDGDGDTGTAGQILSTDGTDLEWINASSANVGSASKVGVNLDSDSTTTMYLTFVDSTSGNEEIRVDKSLTYKPSTGSFLGLTTFTSIKVTDDATFIGNSSDLKWDKSADALEFKDETEAKFGTNNDLKISHTMDLSGQNDSNGDSVLAGTNWCSYIEETGTGPLVFKTDGGPSSGAYHFYDTAWRPILKLFSGTSARAALYHAGSEKLITSSTGITVTGRVDPAADSTHDLGTTSVRWRNIYGDTYYGDGSNLTGMSSGIPTGGIIIWSGAANAIPTGWVLCDGSNSTPDLKGKFVVGYSNTDGDYDVNDTGGSSSTTLSTSQLPSHTHGSGSYSAASAGAHSHTWQRQDAQNDVNYRPWPASNNDVKQTNVQTSTDGAHTHSVSGTSGSTGSGGAIENRPPYYALCYIMKT